MATRIYKDHKCKNNDCDKIAAKDSKYCSNGFTGWYNTNKLKEQATKDMGYNFKFMIMAKK